MPAMLPLGGMGPDEKTCNTHRPQALGRWQREKEMKILAIRWQRLVDDKEQTCPRCATTGETVTAACQKLAKALAPLDIKVALTTEALDFTIFSQDPLQSNRIWIAGRLLEEWLGASSGASRCCDACGDAQCRTISVGEKTFESIPENLIIKAGLLAAAQLIGQ